MYSVIISILACIIFNDLNFINTQEQKIQSEVVLNKHYNGTLKLDYSHQFFKLIIPEGVEKNTQNMVFKVKEPETSFNGRDDFSDPDIYVSTVK